MRCYRYLPVLLPIAGVLLLTGALRGPAEHASSADEPAAAAPDLAALAKAPPDAAATRLAEQALARLDESRLSWLEAGVWLRARLPDLAFTAEGSYVRAPGQRFRVEVRTRLERQEDEEDLVGACTTLAVCDGHDLWTASRIGPQGWESVTRLQLGALLDGPDSPVTLPQVRDEFLRGPVLHGVEVLLRNMHSQLAWVHCEETETGWRLLGRWKSPPAGDQPWPEALPRGCRLVLRGHDYWPARIEWWGPRKEAGPDRLLAELELRNPVFDRPIPDDHCVRLFSFDPGKAPVHDQTPAVREDLANRVKQLAPAEAR
jgi:hypothetical protein